MLMEICATSGERPARLLRTTKKPPAITWMRSRLIHPIHGRDAPIWVRINRAFFSAFICSYSNVPWNIDGPPFWTLSVDLMMAHAINQMLFKHYVCMRDVKRNLEYCSFFLFVKSYCIFILYIVIGIKDISFLSQPNWKRKFYDYVYA